MSIAAVPRGEALTQEFDEIFREHYHFVYRTAYAVTGSRQDAEDILQTIFLRLLRRPIPPNLRNNPKAYLYRAAINGSLSTVRTRKNQRLTDSPDDLETLVAPAIDSSADDELRRLLLDAMTQLAPQAVEILILRYEHNHSDAEIAKMLGKSRGTIAVTLYRTRARLKKLLRDTGKTL
jgi:RNA polymerase sigma-70 factor (ECF subfamily)